MANKCFCSNARFVLKGTKNEKNYNIFFGFEIPRWKCFIHFFVIRSVASEQLYFLLNDRSWYNLVSKNTTVFQWLDFPSCRQIMSPKHRSITFLQPILPILTYVQPPEIPRFMKILSVWRMKIHPIFYVMRPHSVDGKMPCNSFFMLS